MVTLFWLSIAIIVFVYVGYPLSLRLFKRHSTQVENSETPSVAVVIAAFNEADCIEETILNKCSCNYPEKQLSIWVVSDGSSDGTDEIVQKLAKTSAIPIQLLVQSPRQGKTSAVNMAAEHIDADILVFSDANSMYHPDAIRRLVERLKEPGVGYVTGKMVYANSEGSSSGDGCSGYMRYENWLRQEENRVGNVIGVDGGVDAMWRKDFTPLRADQLPDFVQPLSVMAKGLRVVYADDAKLTEEVTSNSAAEYRMRVRVSLRAMWAMWDMRQLLNPLRFGRFSYQLWSHKLLRYMLFVPMVLAGASNIAIAIDSAEPFYLFTLVGQGAGYGLAAWVHWGKPENPPKLAVFCHYFALVNVACAHAFARLIRGEKLVIWQPRVG